MLILTRKENEALVIGEDVVLTVMGIKGNQVRIGIEAPKDVLVLREELVAGHGPGDGGQSSAAGVPTQPSG